MMFVWEACLLLSGFWMSACYGTDKFYIYDWPQFVNRYANFSDRPHHSHGVEFPAWTSHYGAGRLLSKFDMEYKTSQFALFKIMYERALIDPKRTLNPDEATSFLIPYDFGMDATFIEANGRMRKTNCPLANEVKSLLQNSKYYQRHHGHDHTLIVSVNQNMNYFFTSQSCMGIFATCWNCTKVSIDEYMFIARDRNYELANRGINWHAVPFPSDYHYDDTAVVPTPAALAVEEHDTVANTTTTTTIATTTVDPAITAPGGGGGLTKKRKIGKGLRGAHRNSNSTTAPSGDGLPPWERVNENRTIIVSFLGNPRKYSKISTQIREALVLQCANHTRECSHGWYKHESRGSSSSDWTQPTATATAQSQHKSSPNYESRNAVFCLQPPGDMPTRKSVFDSILSGCIPVLFHPLTARLMYEWHFNQSTWEEIAIHFDSPEDNAQLMAGTTNYITKLINIYRYNYSSVVLKKRQLIRELAYSLQYSLIYKNNVTQAPQASNRYPEHTQQLIRDVRLSHQQTQHSTGKLDAYDITMTRVLAIHAGYAKHDRTSDFLICDQIPAGGGQMLQTADRCKCTRSNADPFSPSSVVSALYKGCLKVENYNGRHILTESYSTYPIRLTQHDNWLPHISVTALGFGGGLVEGDRVDISITVNDNGEGCLRTQGSTKVFKCLTNKTCRQSIHMKLGSGSLFAYIPEPTTCFDNSKFRQSQVIHCAEDASLVLVDWFTSGRMERDDFWGQDRLHNEINLFVDGELVFVENQDLKKTASGATIAEKLGNCNVFGMVLLVGRRTKVIRDRLVSLQHRQSFREIRTAMNQQQQQQQPQQQQSSSNSGKVSMLSSSTLVSVSSIGDGHASPSAVVRFTTPTVQEGYEFLAELLKPLSTEMTGLLPYADRLLSCDVTSGGGVGVRDNSNCKSNGDGSGSEAGGIADGPVQMLRNFDKTREV